MEAVSEGDTSLMDEILEELGKVFFMTKTKLDMEEEEEGEGRLSYVGDSMTINLWPVTAFGGVIVMFLVGKLLLPLGRALLGEGAIFAEFLQRQSFLEEDLFETKEPYLYPGFREAVATSEEDLLKQIPTRAHITSRMVEAFKESEQPTAAIAHILPQ